MTFLYREDSFHSLYKYHREETNQRQMADYLGGVPTDYLGGSVFFPTGNDQATWEVLTKLPGQRSSRCHSPPLSPWISSPRWICMRMEGATAWGG